MACENNIYEILHNILVLRSRKQDQTSDIYKIWHTINELTEHYTKWWKI